eukprot:SAG22_NODE_530_length_9427_cov_3.306818_9_plen_181_part_00
MSTCYCHVRRPVRRGTVSAIAADRDALALAVGVVGSTCWRRSRPPRPCPRQEHLAADGLGSSRPDLPPGRRRRHRHQSSACALIESGLLLLLLPLLPMAAMQLTPEQQAEMLKMQQWHMIQARGSSHHHHHPHPSTHTRASAHAPTACRALLAAGRPELSLRCVSSAQNNIKEQHLISLR